MVYQQPNKTYEKINIFMQSMENTRAHARARARTHARTHAHTHGIVRIHNANKEHMHARTHTYTRPRGMVGGYVLKTSLKAG